LLEVIEGKAITQRESFVRGRHEGAWSQGDEGGAGIAGLDFESMPERRGNLPELAFRSEVEIEKNEREVAIAQKQIGTLQGLFGFGTTKPDEASATSIAVGGGIEGVAAVDEGEREVALFGEEFAKHERGSGGRV
jgi:hypothetical protein